MDDEDLKRLLSRYQTPEPAPDLEARLRARLARERPAEPEPETLLLPAFGYAAALSLLLAATAGYYMGLSEGSASALLPSDVTLEWGD